MMRELRIHISSAFDPLSSAHKAPRCILEEILGGHGVFYGVNKGGKEVEREITLGNYGVSLLHQRDLVVNLLVPVACKYCPCGHQFWNKKFPSLSSSSSVEDDSTTKVRRTERTRRDSQRPDYFNSIVIETQSKRRKKAASTSSSPAESVNTESSQGDLLTPGKKKRGRPKTTPSKSISIDTESEKDASTPQSVQEEEEVDIHADLPPLRLQQFKYILMDLNSKISSQNFKPS